MASFPSLPARANLEDLFKAFPDGASELMAFHDVFLRSERELGIGERELIAAYVSGLNACEFCFGAHRTMAQAFGIDPVVFEGLMRDIETSGVSERLKPLLQYAKKVTERDSVLPGDVRAITDAAWTEGTMRDVLMITCLYNFMNRLVDGAGLSPKLSYEKPTEFDLEARRSRTYTIWGRQAGFIPED